MWPGPSFPGPVNSLGWHPDPTWKRRPGQSRAKWTKQLCRDNNSAPIVTQWRSQEVLLVERGVSEFAYLFSIHFPFLPCRSITRGVRVGGWPRPSAESPLLQVKESIRACHKIKICTAKTLPLHVYTRWPDKKTTNICELRSKCPSAHFTLRSRLAMN